MSQNYNSSESEILDGHVDESGRGGTALLHMESSDLFSDANRLSFDTFKRDPKNYLSSLFSAKSVKHLDPPCNSIIDDPS